MHGRHVEFQPSHELLQATMDASTDMIQVFEAIRDEAGGIVDFRWVLNNHTSERKYGEVRGESLLQRNPGVIEEGIFDTFCRVTETGLPEQAERHYVHEQFDGWLKAQSPAWGVRDLGVVNAETAKAGLDPVQTIQMPANNLTVIWRKR